MAVAYVVLAVSFAAGYVTCWLFCAGLGWLVGVLAVLFVGIILFLAWWDKKLIAPTQNLTVCNTASDCHCELE